jgi:hypothetical protein
VDRDSHIRRRHRLRNGKPLRRLRHRDRGAGRRRGEFRAARWGCAAIEDTAGCSAGNSSTIGAGGGKPVAIAHAVLAAAVDSTSSAKELTALARAYLDTIHELTAQGGDKVTIRLDAHRYAAAEALAKAERRTQLVVESLALAIARGSTR